MVSKKRIRECAATLAWAYPLERIVLFGSYAYGAPTEDSDVDFPVVMRHEGNNVEKAAEIRGKVPSGFPMDLIVQSPENVDWRVKMHDFFLKEIMEKGEVLYEADDPGVGREG